MSRDPQTGAALLEVVIALALTAMIAATLTGITGFGLASVEQAEDASTDSAARLVERRSITNMLARIAAPGPDEPSLVGTPTDLIWRGVIPAADGGWQSGIWSLDAEEGALRRCAAMARDSCMGEPFLSLGQIDNDQILTYQLRSGDWSEDWSGDGLPEVIRIQSEASKIDIAPRVGGAAR
ncbi:MAG: hypothetical protein AAF367_02355 [Pseudomonadota bacterium]